jgi:hypothetical protein
MAGAQVRFAALVLAVASACEGERTSSKLEVTDSSGDKPAMVEVSWQYRSGEVDVGILLRTTQAMPCTSVARVSVDEALDGTSIYRMPATDCDTLRIDEDGDLVLFDEKTGHDWSREALDVNTDRELIRLGPWIDRKNAIEYRFELSAPSCEDDRDCDCPQLVRFANDEPLTLELARLCE